MGHDTPLMEHVRVMDKVDAAIHSAAAEIADWLLTPTSNRNVTREGVTREAESIIRRHACYGDRFPSPMETAMETARKLATHELPDQIDWDRARALVNG